MKRLFIHFTGIFSILTLCSFGVLEQNVMQNKISFYTDPQRVHSLNIFEVSTFAGDTVPLRRYDVRERLDRELLAFTYMHSTTFLLIKRANLYFPVIDSLLTANGVPTDFKYLALIESYLNPQALSPSKAAGIWQFVSGTARDYGLEVSDQVDERYDLEKSTVAFCKYIKAAYALYGDWATAMASYNGGRSRISTQLKKQNVTNFFDLYLNEETTRYVYRILAAKEVISHPWKYGFTLSKQDFYHTVRVKEMLVDTTVADWAEWAQMQNCSYSQLRYFNPWICDPRLDNPNRKTYKVKIPLAEDLNFEMDKVYIYNREWLDE
jgi:hypothetical protein